MTPGNILLVRFPFTHLESTKKRPGLLLHAETVTPRIKLLTIAMITSKIEGFDLEGDVQLKDWKQSTLLHPSLVRLSKIATIDEQLIDKEMGTLSSSDLEVTKKTFRKLYNFWMS